MKEFTLVAEDGTVVKIAVDRNGIAYYVQENGNIDYEEHCLGPLKELLTAIPDEIEDKNNE